MKIKQYFQILVLSVVSMFAIAASPLSTPPVFAANCPDAKDFLPGIKPWYSGMCDSNGKPALDRDNIGDSIWLIVLNIISAALAAAGYIAIGFVMWGGTKYILSQGDSGKIAAAKTTIQNALIGLLIALSAVAIVNFVAGSIGI